MNTKKALLAALALLLPATNLTVYAQSDLKSKVPHYRFSNDEKRQLQELRDNPLLKRYAESRDRLDSLDRHRPAYHFISPEGRLNDPNGLGFWNGRGHLFYQAYPPEDTRQHWGHAVSDDMIHWQDLPLAIYPDPESKVYSGATFVDGNRVSAAYHGVGYGNIAAISTDPLLLNWEKLPDPIVPITKKGENKPYNVFDPCIWRKGEYYYALSAGTQPTGPDGQRVPAEYLFRSKDLKQWEYMHQFIEHNDYSLVGDDGACPYFWPIGDKGKHILLHFSHKSGGKYLIGDYDTAADKFIVTGGGNFNHGPVSNGGVHAPSAFPDGNGGIVAIFNMTSGKRIGGNSYSELMTLPRLLTLDSLGFLRIQPYGDIESLRGECVSLSDMALPANREIVLDEVKGNTMEIEAEIDMCGAPAVEIDVLRSPQKEEYTRIVFYRNGGYPDRTKPSRSKLRASAIAIDNSCGSLSEDVRPRVTETADVYLNKDENVKLRIFIDRSVVEVFVNGRQCIAVRTYPTLDESTGVSIRSFGKEARLVKLDAWQMDNIYHPAKEATDGSGNALRR